MQYLAFVQRDEPDGYRATLPDFPGCTARAASWLQIEDAIRMAVRLHVETIDRIPSPTPIELLTEDSAPPNSCWMLVNLFLHEVCPPEHPGGPMRVPAQSAKGLLGSRAASRQASA